VLLGIRFKPIASIGDRRIADRSSYYSFCSIGAGNGLFLIHDLLLQRAVTTLGVGGIPDLPRN
jgi:hypothetical protein